MHEDQRDHELGHPHTDRRAVPLPPPENDAQARHHRRRHQSPQTSTINQVHLQTLHGLPLSNTQPGQAGTVIINAAPPHLRGATGGPGVNSLSIWHRGEQVQLRRHIYRL